MRFQTLNELSQLEDSGFGQPDPRHGLNLLYWFAHDFVEMRNRCMFVPVDGLKNFGFHLFRNKMEDDDDAPLFNEQNVAPQYYEVGNLNPRHQRGKELPAYVSKEYTGELDDSNMDRIIIRVNKNQIHRVYLTQHSNTTSFDRNNTYRVTQGLISIISRMERTEFLQEVGAVRQQPNNNSGWCTIL